MNIHEKQKLLKTGLYNTVMQKIGISKMENETKTNFTCELQQEDSKLAGDKVVEVLIIIFLSSLPVLTIIGNSLVIITVVRRQNFRQKANIFVVSLAITDFAVAIFVMLLSILQEFSDMDWLHDENVCLMSFSFDVMFTTTSILHLMCMTIDRYVAICLPFRYHDLINQRCVVILLLLCWCLPAVISFGLIFGRVHMIGMEDYYFCETKCFLRVNAYYAIICSSISFYIPAIFMLVCNLKIFWNVRIRTRQLREMTEMTSQSSQKEHFLKREASVARTIALMLGCFLICWLPFFLLNVVDVLVDYSIQKIPWMIALWLGYANSTINPYLYYFRNRNYRAKKPLTLHRNCLPPIPDRYSGNQRTCLMYKSTAVFKSSSRQNGQSYLNSHHTWKGHRV